MSYYLVHLPRADMEREIATLLGFDPGQPDTWPKSVIDRIIGDASAAFRERVHHSVRMAAPSYYRATS